MKPTVFVILIILSVNSAAAQPAENPPAAAQNRTASEQTVPGSTEQQSPNELTSASAEIITGTAEVAKQQAVSEVHYETQRQVQSFFNRLFKH